MKKIALSSLDGPLPAPESDVSSRTLAIVGRPNVGKSALFNRIVGRRVAIVHEESGVTRDRLIATATWHGQRFDLIDTGGLGMVRAAAPDAVIVRATHQQVEMALAAAAGVIQVVDITTGTTSLDQDVARLLHSSGRPVVVAANKADHPGLDVQAAGLAELGFPVYSVSALHNRGVDELLTALVPGLPPEAPVAATTGLKVVIVGRPNVGKSSFINRILRQERLIVTEIAGTTRESIEIPLVIGRGKLARHYLLVDTAGMRQPRHIHGAVEQFGLLRTRESIARADIVVLMLDAVEGPSALDKQLADYILEHRRGCVLLVNKWDLAAAGGVTQRKYTAGLRQALPFLDFVPVVYASALSGFNVRQVLAAVDFVAEQVCARLTTGLLNRVLRDATDRVQPPLVHGRRLKLYYATQIGIRPVALRCFVNDPRLLTDVYRHFLLNSLRKKFGLEGAPVVLQFVARPKKAIP